MNHSLIIFFFQAEDGIRDRSPSRGLGDVYKRQEEVSKRFGKEKIAICTDSFAQLQANKARVNEYTSRVILLCDEVDVRTTARLVEVPVLPVSTRADRHGLLKLLMLDNICGVCGLSLIHI